jgi:hypothetical protein
VLVWDCSRVETNSVAIAFDSGVGGDACIVRTYIPVWALENYPARHRRIAQLVQPLNRQRVPAAGAALAQLDGLGERIIDSSILPSSRSRSERHPCPMQALITADLIFATLRRLCNHLGKMLTN